MLGRCQRGVVNLKCVPEWGELRTLAEHLLTQVGHTLGIPLISFHNERWMQSIPLSCLYANGNG